MSERQESERVKIGKDFYPDGESEEIIIVQTGVPLLS